VKYSAASKCRQRKAQPHSNQRNQSAKIRWARRRRSKGQRAVELRHGQQARLLLRPNSARFIRF